MSLLDALPKFARANKLKKANLKYTSGEEVIDEDQKYEDAGLYDANLVTSEVMDGVHIPLIDLDMECALIESSTHGHNHLYINKSMPFEDLIKLLEVMVEVGLVQKGFLEGSRQRGAASLRLPHVKKENEQMLISFGETMMQAQSSGQLTMEEAKKLFETTPSYGLTKPVDPW